MGFLFWALLVVLGLAVVMVLMVWTSARGGRTLDEEESQRVQQAQIKRAQIRVPKIRSI